MDSIFNKSPGENFISTQADGGQRVRTSNYNISKFWEFHGQQGDYS